MKLKEGVIITEDNGEYIIVAAGEAGQSFSGMIRMNSTAGFITSFFENEHTEEEAVDALCENYDVDRETAAANVKKVVESLKKVHLM